MQNFLDFHVAIACQPWAISADVLASLGATVGGGPQGPTRAASRATTRPGRVQAGTAVVPVIGPIQQHRGFFEMVGLGSSCATISKALRAALADDDIQRIVLDFDSPGGACFGIDELATEIRSARNIKPITAVANSLCASAAYWLASSCSEIYCTPGGMAGSIGVIASHQDLSAAMAAAVIKTTLITAGAHKAENNSFEALGAAGRATMQRLVDSYGRDFTSAVAKGRGVPVETVRATFGQGRTMRADAALAAGMINGIATLDEVLARRLRPGISRTQAAQAYSRMPRALSQAMRELDLLSN